MGVITLTKQHTPPSGDRQAGAGDKLTDVVITPQMIEAGVKVLRACVADDDARIFTDDEIINQILGATLKQRPRG